MEVSCFLVVLSGRNREKVVLLTSLSLVETVESLSNSFFQLVVCVHFNDFFQCPVRENRVYESVDI